MMTGNEFLTCTSCPDPFACGMRGFCYYTRPKLSFERVAAAPLPARTPEPDDTLVCSLCALRYREPDKQDQGVERAALREALERLVKAHEALYAKLTVDSAIRANNEMIDAWKAARAALAAHPGVV